MPLSAEDRALRAELSEARFALLRQLELLRYPLSLRGGPPGARDIIATLQQQLADIEEALANLEG
jgi:hypothetical protein